MKPHNITDITTLHYDVNNWKDYAWVMVAKQYPSGGWTTWAWTTVDKLTEFRQRNKSTLIFHSIGHFIKSDKESNQLSDLCFECDVGGETEFEKKLNFRRMQNTVDELYRFFADLGIEAGQIRFFFTGGRSIHVVVIHQLFGVEPIVELNQVMKHIAKYFNDGMLDWDEYHPIDEALYSNPRMFRMPNSYYPKYDAWKIEITPQEFSLSETELRKLAKEPRPPLYDLSEIPTDPIPEAVEWYQERLQEWQELQKEREHIPVDPKALLELTDLPACIRDLRENTIRDNDTRNQATLLDACFCKSTGVPKNEADAIINEWVQRIPDALTDRRRGKERAIATKSVVESVYRGKQYKFACGYAQALCLECDKEACSLYNKTAFQKWGKRVKVIPNFTPTCSNRLASIDELRTALANKVSENGCDLLFQSPPGSGKTETILRTLDPFGNIIYASPRRDMLDEPMNLITHSACQLIKPRHPAGDEPLRDDPPEDKMLYEATALCKYYKQADALAAKRWNVAQKLCSKKCDIGIQGCPYWKQFKVWGSSLITHQILSIPYHMKSLIDGNNPTIVFDEPNPTTLIEQVNITPNVLTEEIARHKNPRIVEFLNIIRTVVENHDETTTYGKALMRKIVATYGSDFGKLLDEVMGWLSVPEDYVEIEVDSISTHSTEKAWLVIIDGGEHWIPRSLCFESDIENKRLMIPYRLAEQKGIDYDIAEKETEEDVSETNLPLNFLDDLLAVLYDEFHKYKEGKDYNSRLALNQTALKQKHLRMNLRRHLAISNSRLILLDAFGDAELLSKLTSRKLEAWTQPCAIDAEVIQIVDGYYGITTMWEKQYEDEGGGMPKRAMNRLIKAARSIAETDPESTLIITWKLIHQHIEKQQKEGKFDSRVVIDHFGNIKGTNEYEHYRQVIIIGAPSIQPDELLQLANAIWHDDPEPLNDEMVRDGNFRPYQYTDEDGNGYAVEVREYKDKRLNLLLKTYREYEIAQAAHRIRPLLYPGKKKIWLLTNLPIDELPPTKVTSLDELIAETNPQFLAFVEVVKRLNAELTGVWGELFVGFSECKQCNRVRTLLQALHSEFFNQFSRRTIFNWLSRAVEILGYESAIITIGGNVRLKVYHNGNLDKSKILKLYAELKGDGNNEKDKRSKRR